MKPGLVKNPVRTRLGKLGTRPVAVMDQRTASTYIFGAICPRHGKAFDETKLRLLDFAREPGRSFEYLYDFGDCWRHVLTVEEVLGLDIAPQAATCIGGARARPPEDVGGTGGYEDFLAIMADPHDPEHRSTKRWCGGHFNPAWFDLAIADKDVRNALKPEVRRRLHQPKPKRTPPKS